MEKINLIHGDCINVMKDFDNNSIDLIVTSPPYYNAREYSQYDTLDHYFETMKKCFELSYKMLKPGRFCCVNVSCVIVSRKNRQSQSKRIPIPFLFVSMMMEIGYEFLEDIQWIKPSGAAKNRNGGFFQHRKPLAYKPNICNEYILVFQKPSSHLLDKHLKNNSLVLEDYEKTNIWKINPVTSSKHTAPFPLEIPKRLIKFYSYENEIVLDMFSGSGTTGIACLETNRKYIGIEQDQTYYQLSHNIFETYKHNEKQIKLFK
jgi:DNA modification methylase